MSRRVVAIAIGTALLLFVVWWIGLRGPQARAAQRAHARKAAAEVKISTLQSQAAALRLQQAQLPAEKAKLAALQQALPAKAALAEVIDDIHQAATASGIDLQSLSQSAGANTGSAATQAVGSLQEVALNMSTTGSYSQIMDYVTRLNLLARSMVVDGLTIGVVSDPSHLSASITGRMFFVPTGS